MIHDFAEKRYQPCHPAFHNPSEQMFVLLELEPRGRLRRYDPDTGPRQPVRAIRQLRIAMAAVRILPQMALSADDALCGAQHRLQQELNAKRGRKGFHHSRVTRAVRSPCYA